jgi:hypothetical protein
VALQKQIRLPPSLETILQRVACSFRLVFFGKGSTLVKPLVIWNFGVGIFDCSSHLLSRPKWPAEPCSESIFHIGMGLLIVHCKAVVPV